VKFVLEKYYVLIGKIAVRIYLPFHSMGQVNADRVLSLSLKHFPPFLYLLTGMTFVLHNDLNNKDSFRYCVGGIHWLKCVQTYQPLSALPSVPFTFYMIPHTAVSYAHCHHSSTKLHKVCHLLT